MPNFTPGPYTVVPNKTAKPTSFALSSDKNGLQYVAFGIKTEDDARLLARAPALYAIVKLIVKEWEAPTEGVQRGELIARLTQYADAARAEIDFVEAG